MSLGAKKMGALQVAGCSESVGGTRPHYGVRSAPSGRPPDRTPHRTQPL